MNLKNKTVLIVGGSQGMGLGAAKQALHAGAKVVLLSRDQLKLDQIVETLGSNCRRIVGDITAIDSYKTLLEEAGPFDHLFISASPGGSTTFDTAYTSIGQTYLYGKFWYTFSFLQAALPFINEKGSITLLSGGFAVSPHPEHVLVTVAFSAIEGLARALAISLAPLRVNAIRPTDIEKDTSTFQSAAAKEQYETETASATLTGRIGRVEDIGETVVYLMSNPFITGQIIELDGGASISYYRFRGADR
ncbi:SDR family oxidoreductase [Taibaiella koreensis]|uniref:SDR family oxidoreductase n=1 Tax=Taibaiella koreensis TaxID=1268548 RepID=UPI000E59B444|nr:SDR family oxidoreductase [Taibaiella koreensis]